MFTDWETQHYYINPFSAYVSQSWFLLLTIQVPRLGQRLGLGVPLLHTLLHSFSLSIKYALWFAPSLFSLLSFSSSPNPLLFLSSSFHISI